MTRHRSHFPNTSQRDLFPRRKRLLRLVPQRKIPSIASVGSHPSNCRRAALDTARSYFRSNPFFLLLLHWHIGPYLNHAGISLRGVRRPQGVAEAVRAQGICRARGLHVDGFGFFFCFPKGIGTFDARAEKTAADGGDTFTIKSCQNGKTSLFHNRWSGNSRWLLPLLTHLTLRIHLSP
jgi:hypothetical protein